MYDFTPITEALFACKREEVIKLVKNALDQGVAAKDVLNKGLIAGMQFIREKMENEEMFVTEAMMAGEIMNQAVDELKPFLSEDEIDAHGKVVIKKLK